MRLLHQLTGYFDTPSRDSGFLGLVSCLLLHLCIMLSLSVLFLLIAHVVLLPDFIPVGDVMLFAFCGPFSIHLLGQGMSPPPSFCAAFVLLPMLAGLVMSLGIDNRTHRWMALLTIDVIFAGAWAFMALMILGLAIT